ncbi:MAG: ATP-binding protein [Myxococcales bacterium]|nr:ATP-binding protein [Myxococcales bacterium]
MTAIEPNFVETLLSMSESDVLDFKQAQYPFAGATVEQKSELVKDILAFANAWKTGDAHIVIGARENPGGRAIVTGIDAHLDDSRVQQLVNEKTNVPVAFVYLELEVEGKTIAIIRVKREQQRPIFLRKAFGRLQPNVVYIRRGSSTVPAAPDEIARMGESAVRARQNPALEVELAEPVSRTFRGRQVTLSCKVLTERPSPPPISKEIEALFSKLPLVALPSLRLPSMPSFVRPGPDPEKLAFYRKELGLLRPLGFCVRNVGEVLAEDVRVVLEVPKQEGIRVVDVLPADPRAWSPIVPNFGVDATRRARATAVEDQEAATKVVACLGKIQPGDTVWSEPFWIGSTVGCELSLSARVLGDNIPVVIDVPIAIRLDIVEGYFDDGEDSAAEARD